MYVHHVNVAQLVNIAGKVGIIPVTAVCPDEVKANPVGNLLIDDLNGQFQFQFGLECPVSFRDLCFGASVGLIAPVLGQIQPGIYQRSKVSIAQTAKYGYLAVGYFAHVATILTAHTNAFVAFLDPATFIGCTTKFLFFLILTNFQYEKTFPFPS